MGAAEEIRLDFRPSSLCQTKDQLVLALRVLLDMVLRTVTAVLYWIIGQHSSTS